MRKGRPDLSFCVPEQPSFENFNDNAKIPFGVSVENIFHAMVDFTDFLRTVDAELVRKNMARLEEMLMPANFSSMVGEFISDSSHAYSDRFPLWMIRAFVGSDTMTGACPVSMNRATF